MYWYTVGYPVGASILCNILNFKLEIKCTILNSELGYFEPSHGMYWYILSPKFGNARPRIRAH